MAQERAQSRQEPLRLFALRHVQFRWKFRVENPRAEIRSAREFACPAQDRLRRTAGKTLSNQAEDVGASRNIQQQREKEPMLNLSDGTTQLSESIPPNNLVQCRSHKVR